MINLLRFWKCFEAYDGLLYDWIDDLKSYSSVHECFIQHKTKEDLKAALETMMKEISQSNAFPNVHGFEVNDRLRKLIQQL
jgi:hypothetical protein